MALTINKLSHVVQGETYLSDINIRFELGSFNVLLGRTLSGKTSLMRLIAGLDRPTTGRIVMNGLDVTGVPVQKRKISMVYQQFINYPNLTVFENIASPLRILREPEAAITDKVEAVATMLHIEEHLQKRPLELSGGQQQRTAMARALVKESDIILFDEPLVNLDYKLREELRFELRELFKKNNTIAIYASTEPSEALALGGSTMLMHEGRIIQSGPVHDVYRNPTRIEGAELFSEPPINILAGQLAGNRVTLKNGSQFQLSQPHCLESGSYQFGLRPHHLRLSKHSNQDVALDMIVDVAEISGSETFLHITDMTQTGKTNTGKTNTGKTKTGKTETDKTGTDKTLRLVAHLQGVHIFHTDSPAHVFFDPRRLYVFNQDGDTVLMPADAPASEGATLD